MGNETTATLDWNTSTAPLLGSVHVAKAQNNTDSWHLPAGKLLRMTMIPTYDNGNNNINKIPRFMAMYSLSLEPYATSILPSDTLLPAHGDWLS